MLRTKYGQITSVRQKYSHGSCEFKKKKKIEAERERVVWQIYN